MIQSRAARLLTLLLAAVQFALPGAMAVADGAAASGGRNAASHVETKGDRDCKPPHTADCAICRYLTGVHSPASATTAVGTFTQSTATPDAVVVCRTSAARYGLHSRAPPTLLD